MKKFLFVHEVEWEDLIRRPEGYRQNVTNWVRIFKDWKNTTETVHWLNTTAEYCDRFEIVMLWLLCEPGNEAKHDKFLELLSKIKRAKVIVYVDGVVGWQMNPYPMYMKRKFFDIISVADYVFCYGHPESDSYWQVLSRGKEFHRIDRPFPVDMAKVYDIEIPWNVEDQKAYALLQGYKGIIGVGKSLQNINEERNAICSLAVASQIQRVYGYPVVVFTHTPIVPVDKMHKYYKDLLNIDSIVEFEQREWGEYIKQQSVCKVAIHLDVLETRGQYALDNACLKVPLVCSGSVAGKKLFPFTYLEYPRDVKKAAELAFRLLEDEEFRIKVIDYAWDKVNEYTYESIGKRFTQITKVQL
jgi:glycosyltransferase involved in cell wall biosynthesis